MKQARRFALTFVLALTMLASGATFAYAQDDDAQSLPDPNGAQEEERDNGEDLPQTGLPALSLLLAGAALLYAGSVARPAPRRRRSHSSTEWRSAVKRQRGKR